MPRRWTITTHVTDKRRDVDLILYQRRSDLRGAAAKFARTIGEKRRAFDGLAVCHGFQRFNYRDGVETESPLVSIIRLSTEDLSPLIVAHEVAHAAQHIYGIDYSDDRPIIEHMHSGNENFAYLYGELFGAVWKCIGAAIN